MTITSHAASAAAAAHRSGLDLTQRHTLLLVLGLLMVLTALVLALARAKETVDRALRSTGE